jgi:cytochrome c-type biogenesis protein CcmE
VKKKLIIGGLVVAVAVGFLFFRAFQDSAATYYTVTQILNSGNATANKIVRVNGDVATGSLKQIPGDLNVTFSVSDGAKTLPVVYRGSVPDTLQEGNPVVIEGSLDTSGVFEAKTLMVKCPSKYAPATPAPTTEALLNGFISWLI